MKIWLVNHYALGPGQPGGTRHFSLARELVRRGHDVLIVACRVDYMTRGAASAPTAETVDGVEFLRIGAPRYRGNTVTRLANMAVFAARLGIDRRLRRRPRPDVIVGSSPHLGAAAAAHRLARRRRVPFVFEVRDIWPQTLIDLGGFTPRHPAIVQMRRAERRLYRAADRIVTLLPGAESHITASGGAPERVVWIPNGVDLAAWPRPEPRAAPPPLVITYTGAHGLANRLGIVLDAAERVQDRPIVFRLVGDGPEKERLRRTATARGLANVEFHPPVPKAEIPAILAASDAGLLLLAPSPVFRHGISPNKLWDYMAAGRPVIFGVDTPLDPVRESGAGISIRPAAAELAAAAVALEEMTAQERARLGGAGRMWVEAHHDVTRLAMRLEATLADAVEHHRAGRDRS